MSRIIVIRVRTLNVHHYYEIYKISDFEFHFQKPKKYKIRELLGNTIKDRAKYIKYILARCEEFKTNGWIKDYKNIKRGNKDYKVVFCI